MSFSFGFGTTAAGPAAASAGAEPSYAASLAFLLLPNPPPEALSCACSNPWGGGDALHYEADPAAAKPAHGTKRPATEPSRGSPPSQRRRPATAPSPPKPGRQWGPWAPACVPAGSERFRVEGREYCYGAGGDAEGGRTRVRAVLRDGTLGPCVGSYCPPSTDAKPFRAVASRLA